MTVLFMNLLEPLFIYEISLRLFRMENPNLANIYNYERKKLTLNQQRHYNQDKQRLYTNTNSHFVITIKLIILNYDNLQLKSYIIKNNQ